MAGQVIVTRLFLFHNTDEFDMSANGDIVNEYKIFKCRGWFMKEQYSTVDLRQGWYWKKKTIVSFSGLKKCKTRQKLKTNGPFEAKLVSSLQKIIKMYLSASGLFKTIKRQHECL